MSGVLFCASGGNTIPPLASPLSFRAGRYRPRSARGYPACVFSIPKLRVPRNLDLFYLPTVQQDHALSLMSSIFLFTMTAADPLLPMNCFCQLMHLLYCFIIPKSGACDCLFVFFAKIKAEHPLGCSGRIDIYCYFSFGIYTIISSTLHSNISHKKSIVWVETFLLARRRDSCPADTLYLLMSWYCVISFFFNVFHNGEYDIIFPFFLPF